MCAAAGERPGDRPRAAPDALELEFALPPSLGRSYWVRGGNYCFYSALKQ